MYLVPYFVESLEHMSPSMYQVWLFLERNGTQLMSVNTIEDVMQFLEENEIRPAVPPKATEDGSLCLVAVNRATTDMSSFYMWSEVIPGSIPMKEVWRPFLWMGFLPATPEEDPLGVNGFLKEIVLAPAALPAHTAYSIARAALRQRTELAIGNERNGEVQDAA